MTTGKLFGLTLLASAALITTAASAQPARQGGQVFSFALTPGEEVPGPGDTAASGTATIVVNAGQGRICWDITTAGIGAAFTISGAHIHSAFAGSAGPIVVHLTATKNGTADTCNCRAVSRSARTASEPTSESSCFRTTSGSRPVLDAMSTRTARSSITAPSRKCARNSASTTASRESPAR